MPAPFDVEPNVLASEHHAALLVPERRPRLMEIGPDHDLRLTFGRIGLDRERGVFGLEDRLSALGEETADFVRDRGDRKGEERSDLAGHHRVIRMRFPDLTLATAKRVRAGQRRCIAWGGCIRCCGSDASSVRSSWLAPSTSSWMAMRRRRFVESSRTAAT